MKLTAFIPHLSGYVLRGRGLPALELKKVLDEDLQSALEDKTRTDQPIKYTKKHTAEIITQACTTPPDGRKSGRLYCLLKN